MATSLRGSDILFNDGTTQSTAAPSSRYVQRVFTSPGTWTATDVASLKSVKVTVVGGGGGGGAGSSVPVSAKQVNPVGGGGGGSGGFVSAYLPVATVSTTQPVTVGAGGTASGDGGTSSFGALISCAGGTKGGNASSPGIVGTGGNGGSVNTSPGDAGMFATTTPGGAGNYPGGGGGFGGGVMFGQGAMPTPSTGKAATNFGAGGSGGAGTAPTPGGVGKAGIVIVEEFY